MDRIRFVLSFALVLLAIAVAAIGSCGRGHWSDQASTTDHLPNAIGVNSSNLVPVPVDAVQPWEKVDTRGMVVSTRSRLISGLYPDSEFQSGVDRHQDDGVSKENGEAIRLASGNSGEKKIAWAMWRLTMGGSQPGVITIDANLGSADAKYYVAVSDYKQNCWQWLGEFDTPHAIIPMKSGEYLSKLGNAFVVVLSYNGASVDVVGAGAHPVTASDTTAPSDVTNPKAEAIPGGLLLSWDKSAASDLAGYQITIGNKPINSLTNTNYALVPYSTGKVTITAMDTSNNASVPIEITVPGTLVTGDIPKINLTTDITGAQRNGKANLKADCDLAGAKYDFDLDGDGLFETLDNTTGTTSSVYKETGILRPAVRVKDSSGIVRAFSAVSLIVTSNSRPVVDLTVDKSYGQAPLNVKYTAEFQDFDGTVDQLWWDANGDGTYEAPIDSPKSPATTSTSLSTIGITNARVRVADNDGASDVGSVAVQVISAPEPKLDDAYEPDSSKPQAQSVDPTISSQTQDHNIYPAGDADWYRFWGTAGLTYEFSSSSTTKFDTTAYIYNENNVLQTSDDDSSSNGQFKISWTCPKFGYYYLKVAGKDPLKTGNYTITYNHTYQGIWSQRGRERTHNGRSYFTGPQTNALKWSYATGSSVYSSPAISADGTVYIGSWDKKLYALNPDGTFKWSYTTANVFYSSPAIGADGSIYIGNNDNILYALNPDGTLKWSYATGDIVQSSPAVGADGTIYVGSGDNKLYAVNSDGTLKWSYTTGSSVYSSPAIGDDGTVYVGCWDNNLYAINANGTLKWSYATSDTISSSPAISVDGTIYVGSGDTKLYAVNSDGTLKWSYATGSTVYSSPAIGVDGSIYIGSWDKKLYALNPDGTLKWSYSTGSIVRSSPAIGADGTIYVGSIDNKLYAIDANGTLKWSYTTGSSIYSSPAIGADGTIYIGSFNNYLYAIGPGEGY